MAHTDKTLCYLLTVVLILIFKAHYHQSCHMTNKFELFLTKLRCNYMSLKGPTVDTEMDQKVWESIIHDVG